MTDLLSRLSLLSTPIRVGIIGAGAMGRGLHYQMAITPGISCVALADLDVRRAVACAQAMGQPFDRVESLEEVTDAAGRGVLSVCTDGAWIAGSPGVDVVVEASSSIAAGGRFAEEALLHGKTLVLMNAEIDLAFGPYLLAMAEKAGAVCTSCDGDQHGVIKRMWDEASLWGIRPIVAGNIKGYLDRYANPTTIIPEADKRHLDYRMATAYTDGTKLGIEMALLANALGLRADVPGMHGPRIAHVREALNFFDLEAISRSTGIVDYILGAEPDGGVFVIGRCDDPYQRRMLAYYKMGDGPFYLFCRPYHLCHIEAMRSIAEAHLDGISLLRPDHGFRADVIAYAKRDLRAGESLDGIGGYTCYGRIENVDREQRARGLSICLADAVRLRRTIAKDERILLEDVDRPGDRDDWRLHERARACGERA